MYAKVDFNVLLFLWDIGFTVWSNFYDNLVGYCDSLTLSDIHVIQYH